MGPENDTTADDTPAKMAIRHYLDSIEAGNSRKNFQSALARWRSWLETERGVITREEFDVLGCRRYARHLKQRARDGKLKAGTATTYYASVRAFLSFCVADEFLDTTPTKAKRATDELPEDLGDADRQFWREDERHAILRFVDDRVDRALDGETDVTREHAFRDRVVVYLFGLSGVRGAEGFAVSADDKQIGITWSGVPLDDGTVRVLGKSRKYEYGQEAAYPAAPIPTWGHDRQRDGSLVAEK